MKKTQITKEQTVHQLGRVTGSSDGKVSVRTSTEYSGLPIFAPYGICSIPPEAQEAAVLEGGNAGGRDICIGVKQASRTIAPGELYLSSLGGGYIYLKNDGTVDINGTVYGEVHDGH